MEREIREYKRDGRSPIPEKTSTSKVMSANKGKNTMPELALRSALWNNNIRGYRLHLKTIPGKPDIAYSKSKLAIFVNGCFWHQCPYCNNQLPKTNTEFWQAKFLKNKERDLKKQKQLKLLGWSTITIWECQIKKNIKACVEIVKERLENQSKVKFREKKK